MFRIGISAVVCCWGLALPARGIQEDLTREQLEGLAEKIVDAEVTSMETRWAGGPRGDIETVVWLTVERTLQGMAEDTLALVLDGGRIGEIWTRAYDEPTLIANHRYNLLLVRDERGRWRVVGGHAGAVPLGSLLCYELKDSNWSYQDNPVEEDFTLNVDSFEDSLVSDELLEEA